VSWGGGGGVHRRVSWGGVHRRVSWGVGGGGGGHERVSCCCTCFVQRFGLNAGEMNLALETYQNEGKLLDSPTSTLKNEGFYRKHTVSPSSVCSGLGVLQSLYLPSLNRCLCVVMLKILRERSSNQQ
jgi:hypothetical protein